jgi:excinuclease ABC subunit A
VLARLLTLVRELEPGVTVSWDQRDAISLRVPGISRAWGVWRTKQADALDCRFLGKKGQLNLARVEGVGAVEINQNRADGDVFHVRLTDLTAEQAARFRGVLRDQLAGFREVFAG